MTDKSSEKRCAFEAMTLASDLRRRGAVAWPRPDGNPNDPQALMLVGVQCLFSAATAAGGGRRAVSDERREAGGEQRAVGGER